MRLVVPHRGIPPPTHPPTCTHGRAWGGCSCQGPPALAPAACGGASTRGISRRQMNVVGGGVGKRVEMGSRGAWARVRQCSFFCSFMLAGSPCFAACRGVGRVLLRPYLPQRPALVACFGCSPIEKSRGSLPWVHHTETPPQHCTAATLPPHAPLQYHTDHGSAGLGLSGGLHTRPCSARRQRDERQRGLGLARELRRVLRGPESRAGRQLCVLPVRIL